MSALSDQIGYGQIIDQYFDAYIRIAEIDAAPVSEAGYEVAIKAELTGDIPIEQVYAYDRTLANVTQFTTEKTNLNLLLDDLKSSILEYLNDNVSITQIFSRNKSLAIVPVDASNFDVVVWP